MLVRHTIFWIHFPVLQSDLPVLLADQIFYPARREGYYVGFEPVFELVRRGFPLTPMHQSIFFDVFDRIRDELVNSLSYDFRIAKIFFVVIVWIEEMID